MMLVSKKRKLHGKKVVRRRGHTPVRDLMIVVRDVAFFGVFAEEF